MEDVQDGKKVSIQDGKTEDPTLPSFEAGVSHVGLQLFTDAMKVANPQVTTSYKTYATATKETAIITTLFETSVT